MQCNVNIIKTLTKHRTYKNHSKQERWDVARRWYNNANLSKQ